MSTATPAPTKPKGAPKKTKIRKRQNISMTDEIIKKAKKMAFADGLSLSRWIEQMIRAKIEESQK